MREDRNLGEVLDDDTEEDVVGNLAKARELTLANIRNAAAGDDVDQLPDAVHVARICR